MFKNYFKIAIRNLIKHKVYSLVNIFGLVMGLACSMVIIIYVVYDCSYDRYHENARRIYRLCRETKTPQGTLREPLTSAPVAIALAGDFPEVENFVRFRNMGQTAVRYGENKFYETQICYADSSVFSVFTFPMLSGDAKTALVKPFSVVITAEVAGKYFGSENPVGKVLRFNNRDDYVVTGVITDLPENTDFSFAFTMLCSMETLDSRKGDTVDDLWSFTYHTYVLLRANSGPALLERQFPSFIQKYFGDERRIQGKEIEFFLHPLTKIHLYSHLEGYPPGRITQVYSFGALALFLVLIACVNFMNLGTARSATRAKEVGVRKVVGAGRGTLIAQFISESILLSFIALIFAFLMMELMLPVFGAVIEQRLHFSFTGNPFLVLGFLLLALLVGLISGSYPAFVLSRFHAIDVLKETRPRGSSKFRVRSLLVILQFFVSMVLIVETLILRNQIQFLKAKDIGFNKNDVVVIPLADESTRRKVKTIKERLKNVTGVVGVGASSVLPGWNIPRSYKIPQGYSHEHMQLMDEIIVDQEFIPTMGIVMAAGRNFSEEYNSDERDAIIINETAARRFGWDDPIGRTIRYSVTPDEFAIGTVCGVVKDFHLASLYRVIEPLCITNNPKRLNHLLVRISPGTAKETIERIKAQWNDVHPDQPFDYSFLDRSYDHYFRMLDKVMNVMLAFTLLAIVISCLGIFALSAHTTELRTKEIGIRKVLGASTFRIMAKLNMEIMRLVMIAIVTAWFFIWLFMKIPFGDLHTFMPYLAEIDPSVYFIAMLLVTLIAFATVSFHSIRAALSNPVEALRYE